VIKKVMNFAQRLVDADRASLFLVDSRTKELYARIFDMGSEKENAGSDSAMDGSVKEIR
jgi:cAMP and cAMP-inhibited cGMP 3',5'-cyclic phosphodiesterase 10